MWSLLGVKACLIMAWFNPLYRFTSPDLQASLLAWKWPKYSEFHQKWQLKFKFKMGSFVAQLQTAAEISSETWGIWLLYNKSMFQNFDFFPKFPIFTLKYYSIQKWYILGFGKILCQCGKFAVHQISRVLLLLLFWTFWFSYFPQPNERYTKNQNIALLDHFLKIDLTWKSGIWENIFRL